MDLETTFFVHREHLIGAPGNRNQPDIPHYSFSPGESCLSFFPIGLLKPLSVQSVQGQTAQKKWLKEKFTSLKRNPPAPVGKYRKIQKEERKWAFLLSSFEKAGMDKKMGGESRLSENAYQTKIW